MSTPAIATVQSDEPDIDHFVFLHDLSWNDYEQLLRMRGDHSAPRISYLEGEVEIMSPSRTHEGIKSMIGCLVEAYCLERGIRFQPLGGWTLKDRRSRRGGEPDECYIIGDQDAERPHIAIEVVWTSGRIDKLEIYRKLGVAEVWYWRKGRLSLYRLEGDRYAPIRASHVLPELDLDLLVGFLDQPTAYDAIVAYREALRGADQAAGRNS
jgi:Uma2 family endonuclease